MQTSAFSRRDLCSGFTLLELLVVMTVVGLMAAMVAPSLEKLVGSIDRATRRDGLVADIAALSFRAYSLGQGFELSNQSQAKLLRDGNPVLAVPSGWRVELEKPIHFGFGGWCSGGRLRLISPDRVVEQLRLAAPDCRIERG
jgi:general secretion pathway protein G